MKTAQQLIKQVIYDMGIDATVRSYSGRAMYGKSCLAVVSNDRGVEWKLGMAIGRVLEVAERDYDDGDLDAKLADDCYRLENRSPSSDSMGLGVVIYWPGIAYEEEEEEE